MKKNRKSELIRKFSAASAWVREIRKESNRAGAVGAVVEDLGCKVLAVLHHEVVLFGQEVLAVDDLDEVADGTTSGSLFYFLDSRTPKNISSFALQLITNFLQIFGSLKFQPPEQSTYTFQAEHILSFKTPYHLSISKQISFCQ